jgi:predicted AAA+ superfamily ATPase
MCAARTGQQLNLSALAADCGITHNTAKTWISVLETSGIVYLLRPYYRNYGKRLVKTPKLHFIDPGLACRLLGIRDREQLFLHPQRGSLFESFILSELLKHLLNAGMPPDLYLWRDNSDNEVDILIENGTELTAVEVKSGQTLLADAFNGLNKWMDFSGTPPQNCYLVYPGPPAPPHPIHITSWDRTAEITGL